MITDVLDIARTNFLDPDITLTVANKSKLVIAAGLFLAKPRFIVENRNLDAFIAEVKKAQGNRKANEKIRLVQIVKQKISKQIKGNI